MPFSSTGEGFRLRRCLGGRPADKREAQPEHIGHRAYEIAVRRAVVVDLLEHTGARPHRPSGGERDAEQDKEGQRRHDFQPLRNSGVPEEHSVSPTEFPGARPRRIEPSSPCALRRADT